MLLLSGSSTQKCKCDWRFLLILKWREIFMCQITLKCLASQGTACCRNSNRSYRSLHWKYQSWMQWRGRVCCRSLHKELRRYKAREGWAFHCDFLIGFYYHCGCISACLAEQARQWKWMEGEQKGLGTFKLLCITLASARKSIEERLGELEAPLSMLTAAFL